MCKNRKLTTTWPQGNMWVWGDPSDPVYWSYKEGQHRGTFFFFSFKSQIQFCHNEPTSLSHSECRWKISSHSEGHILHCLYYFKIASVESQSLDISSSDEIDFWDQYSETCKSQAFVAGLNKLWALNLTPSWDLLQLWHYPALVWKVRPDVTPYLKKYVTRWVEHLDRNAGHNRLDQ